jgi:hypothetical protein
MSESRTVAEVLGAVRQIGFVVRDLDAAMATWLQLGIGPFYTVRNIEQTCSYRGQEVTVVISVAFANSGELQVELIQQDNDSPSIYREFLDAGHVGFNQLAYWVDDVDAVVAALGWPVVWTDIGNETTKYAYVEPPGGPAAVIEIMELNPATIGMGQLIRAAAANWDGTDPVRAFPMPG